MNQQNVDMFILNKGSFFPESSLYMIRERISKCDDSYLSRLLSANFKNPMTGFLYSIGLGPYGADRFYMGQVFIGILKLLLSLSLLVTYVPLCFNDNPNPIIVGILFMQIFCVLIWYIFDIFRISNIIKEYNFTYLLTLLN